MTKNDPTKRKGELGKKLYLLFILIIYFGMGIYFIAINAMGMINDNSYLPRWSYPTLGIILIAYGILRFGRALRKQ